MLQGKWIQIINREGFDPEGYIFKAKGALEDINHLSYRTDSWLLSGDTLKLTIRTNADKNTPMTVYYKVNMVDERLIFASLDPEVNYREVYTKM
ncbi:MAG: lipocalin family protein [Sphingobacteriaceae bacterium]